MFQLSVAGRPRDLPTSHTDSRQVKWGGGGGPTLKSMFYILKTQQLFVQDRLFKVTVATFFNF
jgi:hypothetical protein